MSDVDNFDHGDIVVMNGGQKARVWKTRWWEVWRHVAWLVFRWQQRTIRMKMNGRPFLLVTENGGPADG